MHNIFLALLLLFHFTLSQILSSAKSFKSKMYTEFLFLGICTIGTFFFMSFPSFLCSHITRIWYLLDIKIHWLNLIKTNPRGCVIMMLRYLLRDVHDTPSAKMHRVAGFRTSGRKFYRFRSPKDVFIYILHIFIQTFMSFWNLIFPLSNAYIIVVRQ